jgi:hypothetical protein
MNEYLVTLVGIGDSEEIEHVIVETSDDGEAESEAYMAI